MSEATQDTPVKAKKAPTEYIKVTMEDGRTVEFAASRKTDKTILEDDAGNAVGVRIDFVNGATRTLEFSELSQGILLQSCGHGISQKAGDNYASVKEVEDMVLAVDEIFARLRQGDWAVKGEPLDNNRVKENYLLPFSSHVGAVLEDGRDLGAYQMSGKEKIVLNLSAANFTALCNKLGTSATNSNGAVFVAVSYDYMRIKVKQGNARVYYQREVPSG